MPDTTPPRWVALSWQLRDSSPATDGLSIGRIVQAGIEIADEHGLGGLSLRKLGEQLGAGTMAAYRHMRSKEELIHLMVDVAFGQPPEGDHRGGGLAYRCQVVGRRDGGTLSPTLMAS